MNWTPTWRALTLLPTSWPSGETGQLCSLSCHRGGQGPLMRGYFHTLQVFYSTKKLNILDVMQSTVSQNLLVKMLRNYQKLKQVLNRSFHWGRTD